MIIAIGNDHAGVDLKIALIEHLEKQGNTVINFGIDVIERCNYPVYGEKVAKSVVSGEAERGILICGTGVGISLAANKVNGIRAVVCSEPLTAKLARLHNNTNVLAFGARIIGEDMAKEIVDIWLSTGFEGGGRHEERVALIMDIERRERE